MILKAQGWTTVEASSTGTVSLAKNEIALGHPGAVLRTLIVTASGPCRLRTYVDGVAALDIKFQAPTAGPFYAWLDPPLHWQSSIEFKMESPTGNVTLTLSVGCEG